MGSKHLIYWRDFPAYIKCVGKWTEVEKKKKHKIWKLIMETFQSFSKEFILVKWMKQSFLLFVQAYIRICKLT